MFASDIQCRKISLHQEISIQLRCNDHVNQQAFENLSFVQYDRNSKVNFESEIIVNRSS